MHKADYVLYPRKMKAMTQAAGAFWDPPSEFWALTFCCLWLYNQDWENRRWARFFNVISATHHPASSGRGAKDLENNRANSVLGRLTTHSSLRGSGAKQLYKEAGNKSVFRRHSQPRLKHFPGLCPYYLKTGALGALVSESIRCSQRVQFSAQTRGTGCLPCRHESCSPRIQSPAGPESRALWEGESRCQLRQAGRSLRGEKEGRKKGNFCLNTKGMRCRV